MNAILPTHVAIVPDGNRRWAEMHGLLPVQGHQAGADRMHSVVEAVIQHGIKYLTVWGFSTDNWKRSETEVRDIFSLLEAWIYKDTPWLHSQGVKLSHIGRFQELPRSLRETISQAVNLTHANTRMTLNLAFNYSGRTDILDAVRRLVTKALDGSISIKPGEIDEAVFSRELYTNGSPDVDLVIRTAEEFRLSNFMLLQTAYSEYYFTPVFWPDFDVIELERALDTYQHRRRRFGGD